MRWNWQEAWDKEPHWPSAVCRVWTWKQGPKAPVECLPLGLWNWVARTNKADLFLKRNLVPFQSLKGGIVYGHLLLVSRSSSFPSVDCPGTHLAELPCLNTELLCPPEGLTNCACVSEVFWNYIEVERGLRWSTQMYVMTGLFLFLPTILLKLEARVLWFSVTWSWWDIFSHPSSNKLGWSCLDRCLDGWPSLCLALRGWRHEFDTGLLKNITVTEGLPTKLYLMLQRQEYLLNFMIHQSLRKQGESQLHLEKDNLVKLTWSERAFRDNRDSHSKLSYDLGIRVSCLHFLKRVK